MKTRLVEATLEVTRFMETVEPEPLHVLQVTKNSLALFDCLKPLHQRTPVDRAILEWAALLHDIGWSVRPDGRGHHKASAALIRTHSWKHLLPNEIRLVSLIARYHRKKPPSLRHQAFSELSSMDRDRVRQLSALLRIGDALDRSHLQRVLEIRCRDVGSERVRLKVLAKGDLSIERLGFEKKKDLFEEAFHRAIDFEAVPVESGESP